MQRGRFIFAAVLALAAARAQAASLTLVNTDFTLQNPAQAPTDWQTNGTAGLSLNSGGAGASLDMTHNVGSEAASAWTLLSAEVPSFTLWADVNLDFHPVATGVDQNCPADGIAFVFGNPIAGVGPNFLGGGGGNIGLFGNSDSIPRFIGFEINTWRGQSLSNASDCSAGTDVGSNFAFEDVNPDTNARAGGDTKAGGGRIEQVERPAGMKLLNGGTYRYQWNVDTVAGTMEAYVTGLDAGNKAMQNVKLTTAKFDPAAPPLNIGVGRWGITAGTGGATMGTHVYHVQIVTPVQPAGAPGP